jgi:hypothetical protein
MVFHPSLLVRLLHGGHLLRHLGLCIVVQAIEANQSQASCSATACVGRVRLSAGDPTLPAVHDSRCNLRPPDLDRSFHICS